MSTRVRRKRKLKKTTLNREIKIPKSILEQTLKVINDPQHDVWKDRNPACQRPIHQYESEKTGLRSEEYSSKMSLARTCLLQRDLRNLGKTIAVSNPIGGRIISRWYPLFVKYGVLCLAQNNQRLLNMFLQSLNSSNSIEGFLEKYTQHSKASENNET